ncbi:MAG: Ig-like domain-containing protein [Rikenellaceae bacterium]|jgi:hypothetical protein|nr:Ig-like domain-containing protein [Rikenellaceae bacterium]
MKTTKAWNIVSGVAVAAFFCSGLLGGCANQLSPQGGPKDSLPPRVVSALPAMGARNMTGQKIFIEFNEYVQLKDQNKEFYTSPMMKTKPTLAIKGRGVSVTIKDTLEGNQTYALNFGSTVRDNNEGNPLNGLRYVFSTGAAIDSMMMTGYTADAKRSDSISKAFIFFYDGAIDTIPAYDSILLKNKPSAVGRGENNGIFIAQNLKPIPYKIYAIEDKNGNQQYDPGVDKVGFLDTLCNPAEMGAFAVWLDEYRKYPTADPQVYFRMFTDGQFRRHNLVGSERVGRHEAVLRFSAPRPTIDSLVFDSIPAGNVIWEYPTEGRDTISLWFAMPPEALPDTIKGRIAYLKHDSINNLIPTTSELRLAWRYIESKEEQREREKEEKARAKAEEEGEEYTPPKKPNPFNVKIEPQMQVNPEKGITLGFEMPLVAVDTARILLTAVTEGSEPQKVEFSLARDTVKIREWKLSAEWDPTKEYTLSFPAGVFTDVAGQTNDSIGNNFTILQKEKFATLIATVVGKTPEAKYIVEILGSGDRAVQTIPGVVSGVYSIFYIPEGEIRIRVTEDSNGNGKWDTGNLIERRQPERVEYYVGTTGSQSIPTRTNWEVEATLDMNRIFAPTTIERVRAELQRAEDARVAKWLEEKAKRDAQKQGTSGQVSGGGLGIGGALGGAKQQLQSTMR